MTRQMLRTLTLAATCGLAVSASPSRRSRN